MANIKSAKKRIKTNETARTRNKSVRSEVKTKLHEVEDAIESGDPDAIETAARNAQSAIAIAERKGVLHKNTAARKQSTLAALVEQSS